MPPSRTGRTSHTRRMSRIGVGTASWYLQDGTTIFRHPAQSWQIVPSPSPQKLRNFLAMAVSFWGAQTTDEKLDLVLRPNPSSAVGKL